VAYRLRKAPERSRIAGAAGVELTVYSPNLRDILATLRPAGWLERKGQLRATYPGIARAPSAAEAPLGPLTNALGTDVSPKMEYYWGYAAASSAAPLPSVFQKASNKTPQRSSSTKIRRSRFPGHRRTASSESTAPRPSHETAGSSGSARSIDSWHSQQSLTPHVGGLASTSTTDSASNTSRDPLDERERMPTSIKYQNKQLPATPRLDTHPSSARYSNNNSNSNKSANSSALARTASNSAVNSAASPGAGVAGAPAGGSSTRTPVSAPFGGSPPHKIVADRRSVHHAAMPLDAKPGGGLPFGRTESVSSTSGTTVSTRTMLSSDPPLTSDGGLLATNTPHQAWPFVVRNGRTYLSDTTLSYPLPVDLNELNRQSIRTLLLFQLFGGPICSPAFANKPPQRVLEVGCGTGFWSMMCHRYYSRHGAPISFTGIDLARIGSSPSAGAVSPPSTAGDGRPDKDMKWRLVQHDMRHLPWPFADDEFDLVMVKDMSLATQTGMQQDMMDEYLRVLRPGGTLEIWESDHTLRMLRPHTPEHNPAHCSTDDEEDHEAAASLGAYLMTANTPLSAPLNNFLVEYNGWIARALELRYLSSVPCTLIGPMLVQEAEVLQGVGSRRLAVPLSEIKWEREGVGGVITKDGKSYVETGKGKKGSDPEPSRKMLTAGQLALRKTALLTVVQMIQNLEPLLREVSGKSQDEWDGWTGKMMNDLMKENGTSWGECLEVGAWWARKRK
jgi:SAM-dependent methyltransferase